MTAPFWPVINVGIARLCRQRLPFAFSGRLAPSAECGPWGSTRSNVEIGASGTELNVEIVMPVAAFTVAEY
jgi:hypothetical protein